MSIDSAQRIIKKIHISISVNSTGKSNSGLLTPRKINTSLPYTKKGVEERKVRKEERKKKQQTDIKDVMKLTKNIYVGSEKEDLESDGKRRSEKWRAV